MPPLVHDALAINRRDSPVIQRDSPPPPFVVVCVCVSSWLTSVFLIQGKSLNAAAPSAPSSPTGFGRSETLPMLPERDKAESILRSLMDDPGVKACMKSRDWHVPVLAEMYPEGKVGVSDVCVMGLNVNKGEKILLRLRTDDLLGFRKIASIRKVLYHELAHNSISPHDNSFFELMRVVERECTEMNWAKNGATTGGSGTASLEAELAPELAQLRNGFLGGTNRLGGDSAGVSQILSAQTMAGSAAIMRLTQEEQEVVSNCGCGDHEFEQEGGLAQGGLFEAGEQVSYDTKLVVGWVKVVVKQVHLASGPDEPYYTIEYEREGMKVEKQTIPARLRK